MMSFFRIIALGRISENGKSCRSFNKKILPDMEISMRLDLISSTNGALVAWKSSLVEK